MKLFLGFSNKQSEEIANRIHKFIIDLDIEVEPFLSEININTGEIWESKLFKNLSESDTGLICVTKENMKVPWINFEAGVFLNVKEERGPFLVLINVDPVDLIEPLCKFQARVIERKDFEKLLTHILNRRLSDSLTKRIISDSLTDEIWYDFESDINKIKMKYGDFDDQIVFADKPCLISSDDPDPAITIPSTFLKGDKGSIMSWILIPVKDWIYRPVGGEKPSNKYILAHCTGRRKPKQKNNDNDYSNVFAIRQTTGAKWQFWLTTDDEINKHEIWNFDKSSMS